MCSIPTDKKTMFAFRKNIHEQINAAKRSTGTFSNFDIEADTSLNKRFWDKKSMALLKESTKLYRPMDVNLNNEIHTEVNTELAFRCLNKQPKRISGINDFVLYKDYLILGFESGQVILSEYSTLNIIRYYSTKGKVNPIRKIVIGQTEKTFYVFSEDYIYRLSFQSPTVKNYIRIYYPIISVLNRQIPIIYMDNQHSMWEIVETNEEKFSIRYCMKVNSSIIEAVELWQNPHPVSKCRPVFMFSEKYLAFTDLITTRNNTGEMGKSTNDYRTWMQLHDMKEVQNFQIKSIKKGNLVIKSSNTKLFMAYTAFDMISFNNNEVLVVPFDKFNNFKNSNFGLQTKIFTLYDSITVMDTVNDYLAIQTINHQTQHQHLEIYDTHTLEMKYDLQINNPRVLREYDDYFGSAHHENTVKFFKKPTDDRICNLCSQEFRYIHSSVRVCSHEFGKCVLKINRYKCIPLENN